MTSLNIRARVLAAIASSSETGDRELLGEVFVSGPLEALVAEIFRIAEMFDADADEVSYA